MHGENAVNLGDVFTVLEPIGEDSESKRLRLCYGFIARRAVHEDAGKIGHFADPATIILALDLHREVTHTEIVQLVFCFAKSVGPTELGFSGAVPPRAEATAREFYDE